MSIDTKEEIEAKQEGVQAGSAAEKTVDTATNKNADRPRKGHGVIKTAAGIIGGTVLTVGVLYGVARVTLPGLVPEMSLQTVKSTALDVGQSVRGLFGEKSSLSGAEDVSYTRSVIVPDLVGKTEKQALQTATSIGLGVRFRSETKSNAEEGTIVEQDPAAGEIVDMNSTIYYVTSLGAPNVTVPDVTGMPLYEAVQTLENAGFSAILYDYAYSDASSTGKVLESSHRAGEEVSAASHISLSVGRGLSGMSTTVGDYRDLSLDDALAKAQEDRLIPIIRYGYSDFAAQGCIMRQSLDADMSVPYGEAVELTVCSDEYTPESTVKDFTVTLEQGASITGAPCRFVLTQEDGSGMLVERTIAEQDTGVEYPYALTITNALSQTDGTITVYEQVDTDNGSTYVPRCNWSLSGNPIR